MTKYDPPNIFPGGLTWSGMEKAKAQVDADFAAFEMRWLGYRKEFIDNYTKAATAFMREVPMLLKPGADEQLVHLLHRLRGAPKEQP